MAAQVWGRTVVEKKWPVSGRKPAIFCVRGTGYQRRSSVLDGAKEARGERGAEARDKLVALGGIRVSERSQFVDGVLMKRLSGKLFYTHHLVPNINFKTLTIMRSSQAIAIASLFGRSPRWLT